MLMDSITIAEGGKIDASAQNVTTVGITADLSAYMKTADAQAEFATKQQVADLTGAGAPATLDQISELAAAIGNDPNYGANTLAKIEAIPYDLAGSNIGKPTAGVITRFVAVHGFKFLAGMTASKASAAIAATASTVFSIAKNGTVFATFTFAAGASTATFACAADTSFVSGDVLTVVAPAADATLSDLQFTFAGKPV